MSSEEPTQPWYTQTWIAVVALVLFFPLGVFLMWRFQRWEVWIKTVITVAGSLLTILFIVAAATGEEDDTTKAVRQEASPSPTVETSPSPADDGAPTPVEDVGAYSLLELTDVGVVDSDNVLISGITDLPDGAILIVGFDVAGRSDSDLYIGVDQKTTVTSGEFSVTLAVPQRDEFISGPYEISVSFTPRGQSDNLIGLVGKDGENLTGNLVDDAFGFRTMRLVETRDLDLSVAPPSFAFQLPSEFSEGSAERALAEYVSAWKNQDWSEMVKWSQMTWADGEPDPAGVLEAWYDFKTLKGFEIKDVEVVSEVTTDITFVVHYEAIPNQISKKQIAARVIRETAPYEPSPQGEWGVNPISALRETDVD
jgi:hypothetical protein